MGGGRAPPPFRAGFSATSPAAAAGNPLSFRPGFFTTNHSAISFRTAAAAAVPPSFLASTLLVDVPSSPPAPLLGARARAWRLLLSIFSPPFFSLPAPLRGSFFSLPSFTGRPPLLSVRCSSKPPIPSRLRLCLGVVRCSCLRLLTGISAFPVLTPTPASPLPCASHRPLRMRCRALMPQSFDRQRIAY